MTPSPPVALTYLRLSTPDRTDHASIDRQREDCLALTEHLTLTGREEFTDKAVSAYQRRQRRPGFDRLLDRLRDLNRVVIVTWHLDRLLRQPVQLEELLDLASTRHVRIETVHGGGLDLSGHEGRLFARFLVAFAHYESALKATRVSRAHQQRASSGLWHAGPAYGYDTGGTLNPQQAIIVRQIADDYLAGCSPQEIARRLNAQGIPTAGRSSGWHPSTVRAILSSDRLHGHRRFTDTNDATATVNGRWPRIITPRESDLVRALLALPERRTTNSSQSLLGGLARCGVCDKTLVVSYDGNRLRRYVCRKTSTRQGCGNGIAAGRLDEHIGAVLRNRLVTCHPADVTLRLWPTVSSLAAERTDTITRFARGTTDLDTHRRLHDLQRDESARLSQAAVERTPPTPLDWDDLGVPERRRAIQRQIRITVLARRHQGRFDPERVIISAQDSSCSHG